MGTKPITIERVYNAAIEKVWKALTDNNELKKWYFQLENFKPVLGFRFEFSGGPDDGPQYLHLCEIVEVIDGKRIVYTWRYDGYSGNSTLSWELFQVSENETRLKFTHTGLESFAENGKDFSKESFKGGWNYFINEALKKYLET